MQRMSLEIHKIRYFLWGQGQHKRCQVSLKITSARLSIRIFLTVLQIINPNSFHVHFTFP